MMTTETSAGKVYVSVHRTPTGEYWSTIVGDVDVLVGVSVTEHEADPASSTGLDEEGETVYQNDESAQMWEDFNFNGGPFPLDLGDE